MRDIETGEEIETIVDTFYENAREDDKIGYFFNDSVNIDWDSHIPIIHRFWKTMLLGELSYRGRILL
jgi:hemoglobin